MNRYLLNISYIGTSFRGVQKTQTKVPVEDSTTIQGCIEKALEALQPVNQIQLTLSSRTDAGVHGLHSTVHVDLEKKNGGIYPPDCITKVLNKRLNKLGLPIRIISTIQVSNNFHCRFNAKARTYLYRIAVLKLQSSNTKDMLSCKNVAFIPIEEEKRCFFLQDPDFDIEKFKEASKLFLGCHDFKTFMGSNKDLRQKPIGFTVRTIEDVKVEKGTSLASPFDAKKANEIYNYWNIKFTGKSFLYRQVRRMVSALIAVAYNRITKKDIYEMLTVPSQNSWSSKIVVVPPHALFLCKVHYNEEDFELDASDNKIIDAEKEQVNKEVDKNFSKKPFIEENKNFDNVST